MIFEYLRLNRIAREIKWAQIKKWNFCLLQEAEKIDNNAEKSQDLAGDIEVDAEQLYAKLDAVDEHLKEAEKQTEMDTQKLDDVKI